MKNFLLLCLFLSLTACASKELTQKEIDPTVEEQQNMQAEFEKLQNTVVSLEAELANAQAQIEILDPNAKQEAVTSKPSTPKPTPSPAPAPASTQETQKSAQLEPTTSLPSPKPEQTSTQVSTRPQPQVARTELNAYENALKLYQTGQFKASHTAFTNFLHEYPSSSYVANALYWDAETFYAQGLYPDSILIFKDILARFPQSSKSADALLKIALAYQKLGDASNSALHVTVLLEDWPKSEATTKARQLNLKSL